MGFQDAVNYVLFTNPISSGTLHYTSSAASSVKNYIVGQKPQYTMSPVPLWKLAANAGPYVKLAAASGAIAVALGAYGSHKKYLVDNEQEHRRVFETANRYHFIHTLTLLSLPLCRAPFLAATFHVSGIIMFCGSCYYHAFTGDKKFKVVTPAGGVCFILGWLAMLL